MRSLLRHLGRLVSFALVAALVIFVTVYVFERSGRVALKPWHLVHLDAEFRAADAERVKSLDDYRRAEDVVFNQLDTRVYGTTQTDDLQNLNRYAASSRTDPRGLAPDWNRTIELSHPDARGAALLVHGLTDSPYSMRALAERLHARGYWVVALRLPGHGTAPSGLLYADWRDWAAAVRIAARHLASKVGAGRPLLLVGYSTGAALAVEYSLSRLHGESLPQPSGLILVSPAIGVSALAVLARWRTSFASLPGLAGLAWTDVGLEYDPHKYQAFALHSADQVYRLTRRIQTLLDTTEPSAGIKGLPRILAFQSVADATVSTPAVIDAFFRRLAPDGHQLVLFDLNRHAGSQQLIRPAALAVRENLLQSPPLPFDLTVLTNTDADSIALAELRRPAQSAEVRREATGLEWPAGVFSLSHVALPFPPDDPIYGAIRPAGQKTIYLGRIELLGEKGLLAVSPEVLLRLRHNPFFGYVTKRIDVFLGEAATQ